MKPRKSILFYAVALGLTCTVPASAYWNATSFSGGAVVPFETIKAEYAAAASATATTIQTASMNMTNATGAAMGETQKAVYNSAMKSSSDYTSIAMTQTKLEMNYQRELAAREIMSQNSPIHPTDTPEEIDFLVDYLRRDDIKDQNMFDVIAYAEKNLDGKAQVIVKPLPTVSTDGSTKSVPDNVGTPVTLTPSVKLKRWAEFCAESVKAAVDQQEKTLAQAQTTTETAKTTQAVVENTSPEQVAVARRNNQKAVTCTPDEMQNGVCSTEITQDEYVDKVIANEIVPNGHLSSSNFYSPQSYGGAGYMSSDDPQVARAMELAAVDALEPVEEGGVQGAPDIVYTYRNSNQLNAAKAFSETIVNPFMVGNQEIEERAKPESAEFQAEFMSRQASLNLAQNTFDNSITRRRGTNLSKVNSSSIGEMVKESQDGAGELDRLNHEVKESFEKFSPKNIEKLATDSKKTLMLDLLKEELTANKITFQDILEAERQELLLATILANLVNSPANVEYLKENGGG
ncbi:hypothetical protein [Vibrio crassostreae]|uniref:hypothetical protein n=1 Tax=Vibrio crassostreae TaxID=246167 RepID=UPI001B30B4C5|nr:hypothetical protein [Vibrio crassostreae]